MLDVNAIKQGRHFFQLKARNSSPFLIRIHTQRGLKRKMLSRYKVLLSLVMIAVILTLTGCGDDNKETGERDNEDNELRIICYGKTNRDNYHGK